MDITSLFINICIMCTLMFIYGQMLQNQKFKFTNILYTNICIGLIGGAFGSILIVFGMNFSYGLVVDYRNITLTLAAMLGGEVALILTGSIIGLFRTFYYGMSIASILGGVSVLLSVVGGIVIVRIKMDTWKKWSMLFCYSSLCTLFTIVIVLANKESILLQSMGRFIIVSMIGGYIAYILYGYIMEVQSMYKYLEKEVDNDYLTGLKNKKKFNESLESIFEELKQREMIVAVIMFDIDYFKHINDTYGHLAGDAVLKQLGGIAKGNNKEDKHCRGVYRVGGEEFAIIIIDELLEEVVNRAESLRSTVEKNSFILPTDEIIQITISSGISLYPCCTISPYDLVREADEALYMSKETGRNKVSI